jgi:hypothetical protein
MFTVMLRLHLGCCQPGCVLHSLLTPNRFLIDGDCIPYGISG